MSFSSIEFVVLLPPLIAVYWLLRVRSLQSIYLAIVTALFMAFNGRFNLWVFLTVLLATMLVLAGAKRDGPAARQRIIRYGIALLIVVLGYYKYLPWLSTLWWDTPVASGSPLGISYYTFILIGFLVDSARDRPPLRARRLPSLLLFFPFLSSGPIVRLRSWSAQVSRGRKRDVMRKITSGTHLFMIGAIKKILIADAISFSTAPIWANPQDYARSAILIAIVGFYVQLYADFSGYTDMARGVARMMGFHLPINFKAPYFAVTPTEFWSRWHISLTGWIRDYVFTPLSATVWRRFPARRLAPFITFALSVVLMTLVGLWHGASTNFVLFGMFHGVLIGTWYAMVGTGRRLSPRQRMVSWALFQVVLMFSMTMFRADTLGGAAEMVRAALLGGAGTANVNEAVVGLGLSIAAVYSFQRSELRPSRRLARFRSALGLFPVFLILILAVLYMKGLTLEGVWISPGDPFFNQGQEKFIYLKF